MRGVSRRVRQFAMLLALLTVFIAQTAVAKERDRRPVDRFERAKRFIVELLGRLGPPPGDEDEDSGRLSPPPGDSSRIGLPPGDEAKSSGVTIFSRFGTPPGEE